MQIQNTPINCPNCDHPVNVSDILHSRLEADIRRKYEAQLDDERSKFEKQQAEIATEKNKLQQRENALQQQVDVAAEAKLTAERHKISKIEREKAKFESQNSIAVLQKELNEKTEQVQELNKSRAEVLKLQREKDSMKAELDLENERKLSEQIDIERKKITKLVEDKSTMLVKDRDGIINKLKVQLTDAKRQAEQGSIQLQGETQEIAIEEWLGKQYPSDTITGVKKGARGADCMQSVNTDFKRGCGTIYYESKRTKAFQPEWIEKFKVDIKTSNADIGVLVSEARPSGHDRMTIIKGVWVCNFDEFKGLSMALRNQITEIDRVVTSQENRGDKMSILWGYLQSNEFRLEVEAIVDGFTTLKTDLDKEKRAMNSLWKKREKQIDKVLISTSNMYSSIKGIAGSQVQDVAALEFDDAK